ncbi:MAG TPA: hypothetical protein VMT89_04055, partial [Candidatus Acidoferrales bacterium]|nr:hypothetical protein [Candidatus Acidoferrales bacterium]
MIPGTIKTFNSTLGATNRPFAAPGESVEVRVRPCDVASTGIPSAVTSSIVTVLFTPTAGGAARHAVVLTAASDCSAITPQLAACNAQLGAGGSSTCVSAAASGLQVVDRDDVRSLRFTFPDTDALIGTPTDDVTLAGPVKIAVSAPGAALPCGLATQTCAAQTGLAACIDNYYANDGACGTGTPLATFPTFTALPPPNDYQADCFSDSPPCNANATSVRAALDADGNVLTPFAWTGILVRDSGIPVPRLLQSHLKSPLPFSLNDPIYIGSYTPEGGLLPPIFEPQRDPSVMVANMVSLFGSADAPYTILRFARRQGTCNGGGRNTLACSNDTDCPGGSCAISGQNFDFSIIPNVPSGGPMVVPRVTTNGFCEDTPTQTCNMPMTCSSGPCVNYSYEAHIPVPLEGLAASDTTRSFSVRESIDGVDRNGDGDTDDTVVVLRDRVTGEGQPLGAPPMCGLSGTPDGRGIVRISDPPFTYPAVAVENDVLAFLESEASEKFCAENGDDDSSDALLRIVRLGAGETGYASPLRAADAAPKIDRQPLTVSNGVVFVRSSEVAMAARRTEQTSVGPGGVQGDANSYNPSISADGRFVAFQSHAFNLLGPGGDPDGYDDVFVHDRQTGGNDKVSVGPMGVSGDDLSGYPSLSADGRFVAFVSYAENLLGPGGDTNVCPAGPSFPGQCPDVFVRDRQLGATTRVSVGPMDLQADDASSSPTISSDGRYVAFESNATNLLGPGLDTNGTTDVFVHDRQTGTTELVSVGLGNVQGDKASGPPSISPDGRFVVFESLATNLSSSVHDTNGKYDVYIRDRHLGITELVSVGPGGLLGDGDSYVTPEALAVSADGRFVVFASAATNLLGPGLDTNNVDDVFLRDRQAGTTERLSVGPNGVQGNGASDYPSISADGRFVAFNSNA